MTQSNRFLNRLILLLLGIAALGMAVMAGLPLLPAVTRWTGFTLDPWLATLPRLDDVPTMWGMAGAAAAVIALSIAWIATRGRGRTSDALSTKDIIVDDAALADIVRAELHGQPDVLAVAAQGYRRGGGAVLVRIEIRSRANLSGLLDRLRTAVAAADATIGAAVPLVIHLTTGVRTATTGSRTTR